MCSDDPGCDLEAVSELAERVGECSLELDLRGRERARAELVLEPADAEAVGPPADASRDEEAREAVRPRRRANRTSRDDELVRVGDRAEPLLAAESPGARLELVRDSCRLVRADVVLRAAPLSSTNFLDRVGRIEYG